MIERVCETCGEHFFVYPYRLRKGEGRFCSMPCFAKSSCNLGKQSGALVEFNRNRRGIPLSDEHRRRISESAKGRKCPALSEFNHKRSGIPFSDEHRRKISESRMGQPRPKLREINRQRAASGWYRDSNPMLGRQHTPETKGKIRNKRRAYIERTPVDERRSSPETRRKLSEVRKAQWQDPDYVAKLIKAMGIRPNKLESKLIQIFEKHLPDFKYNGGFDLGISLGGLIPDFVNANGKKQVIEVFGNYWHSPQVIGDDERRTEAGKIAIYNSLGYKCLVLWEDDLKVKSDQEIIDIVTCFQGGKKCHHSQLQPLSLLRR